MLSIRAKLEIFKNGNGFTQLCKVLEILSLKQGVFVLSLTSSPIATKNSLFRTPRAQYLKNRSRHLHKILHVGFHH